MNKDDKNPILAKVEEVAQAVETFKETQEKRMKKYDALDEDKIAKVSEFLLNAEETRQKLEAIEKAVNRVGFGAEEERKEQTSKETREKFNSFIRGKGGSGEIEIRALSTNDNANGGYLVMPELSNKVISRIFETSPMRRIASVETTAGNSKEFLIDDNAATAQWEAEGASTSETNTPAIGKATIYTHKLTAYPKATEEMLADGYLDVESWLASKVADILSRTENTAFITGDGVGKPKGIMSYTALTDGTYARDGIQQVNSGSSGAVTQAGLVDLQYSLKEPYQANAKFLMQRATMGAVMKLKDTSSYQFLGFQPNDRQGSAFVMTLLGKEVVFCDDVAAIAANSLSIAYGDFAQGYTILDKAGLIVIRDPFTSAGFIKFRTAKRVGGGVTNYEAIKIQKLA